MLEMTIDSIRVSLMNYQRVVILRAKDSDRYLPIWIGPAEADSIALKLQDVSVPRPLTHDLLHSVIIALGATINHIVVSDLTADTFYAKIVLQHNGTSMEVDSRPSDAIAIAVRGGQLVTGTDGGELSFTSVEDAQKHLADAGIEPSDDRYEIRSKVPILVDESVLERAGLIYENTPGALSKADGMFATRKAPWTVVDF